jgi:hypothetical protein
MQTTGGLLLTTTIHPVILAIAKLVTRLFVTPALSLRVRLVVLTTLAVQVLSVRQRNAVSVSTR